MAQKIQVLLIDDLDGSEATETVSFGLDGTSYEIELSGHHADLLRKELADYIACARKTGSTTRTSRNRTTRRDRRDRTTGPKIRAWAKARGYKVNESGRIPGDIAAAYDAEH